MSAKFPVKSTSKSFARRELVAPVGLWERGPEASGSIPPSGRLFPLSDPAPVVASAPALAPAMRRAPKAGATSPSGETGGAVKPAASSTHPAPAFRAARSQGSCFGFNCFRKLNLHWDFKANATGSGVGCCSRCTTPYATFECRKNFNLCFCAAFCFSPFLRSNCNIELNDSCVLHLVMFTPACIDQVLLCPFACICGTAERRHDCKTVATISLEFSQSFLDLIERFSNKILHLHGVHLPIEVLAMGGAV